MAQSKQRMREIPGIHSAREVLKVRPRSVREIWLVQGYERNSDLKEFSSWASSRRVKIQVKPEGFLRKLTEHHQGVCVLSDEAPELDRQKLENAQYSRIVALDGITDPHNLGAILRTSWLLGVDGILVPEHRSASLTPTAIKVASGGAEHVPVESHVNLPSALQDLKDQGFWIFGFDHTGKNELQQIQFPEKTVLVMGAEDKGMRVPVKKICDELVAIPQADPEASFNASVAAAIGLYEVFRQHRNPLK